MAACGTTLSFPGPSLILQINKRSICNISAECATHDLEAPQVPRWHRASIASSVGGVVPGVPSVRASAVPAHPAQRAKEASARG